MAGRPGQVGIERLDTGDISKKSLAEQVLHQACSFGSGFNRYSRNTAAEITEVHKPFFSPSAVWTHELDRTILPDMR